MQDPDAGEGNHIEELGNVDTRVNCYCSIRHNSTGVYRSKGVVRMIITIWLIVVTLIAVALAVEVVRLNAKLAEVTMTSSRKYSGGS